MIALAYRESLPEGTADELDQLINGLTGMLYQEHDPEGHHTDITANSLTINKPDLTNGVLGTITFQDRLGRTVVMQRTDAGTIITLNSGQMILVRNTDISGTIRNLVEIGQIQIGAGGFGNGIAMLGIAQETPTLFHDWALISGTSNVSPGARLLVADITTGESPLSLRYRASATTYEWMKTTGTLGPLTALVNLGSDFDSSLQGYFDKAFIKQLFLQTAGNNGAGIGVWVDATFSAGDFTGSGAMTWTVTSGEKTTWAYKFVGPSMSVAFDFQGTTVGGTPDVQLEIVIPVGFSAVKTITRGCVVKSNGTQQAGYVTASGSKLFIGLASGATWANGTTNNDVHGDIEFPVA